MINLEVQGIGTINMRMHDGVDRVLKDVKFVPELKKNLIPLGTLESKECIFKSESSIMKVINSLVVMKGIR